VLQRRWLLTGMALMSLVGPVGCSTPQSSSTTSTPMVSNIKTTIRSVVTESSVIVTILTLTRPTALSPAMLNTITQAQQDATTLVNELPDNLTTANGGTSVSKIFTSVNTILQIAGPILTAAAANDPKLQSAAISYNLIVPLLPIIETWLAPSQA